MSQPQPQAESEETTATELSAREQLFIQFYEIFDFQEILSTFKALCEEVGITASEHDAVFPSLKRELTVWKAAALWQLLDTRAGLPEYEGQRACKGKNVLVIGAGPVGLRAAIEASLLGAKVDLVEKRTNFSRNNSLHLWPFLINDLRALGAKKFYGKFASGNIDHICIRILQSVLLKVCLIFGVHIFPGVSFTGLSEPKNANSNWAVNTTPTSCPVASTHYDIIVAADGKLNSLPGFQSKEFRAKLALAITANFVNHYTTDETSVEEISGVSYVYRQDFFKSLAHEHGIELENIVYYKDETHYFVMTAKKPSLLRKGVLIKDNSDPKQLLSSSNIDQKALERYAVEAATFSTEGGLKNMEFEKNHRGKNDVALFDFTSLFAADNAARIIERKGKRILLCLAGDSLIEPFWPTGSGCARGFLGAFDVAWMMKRYSAGVDPMELLEEREAIYYLLPQTTPERLHKNLNGYTIDPKTRYPNLSELVPAGDVCHLYDTDNPNAVKRSGTRSQAQPATSKRTEDQRKSIVASEDRPKRSKSIEGLASKAQSVETPFDPAIIGKGSVQAKPVSETSKSPLQKRQQKPAKVVSEKVVSGSSTAKPWQKKSDKTPPTSDKTPPTRTTPTTQPMKEGKRSPSPKPWRKKSGKTSSTPPPPPQTSDEVARSSPKPWQSKTSQKEKPASPERASPTKKVEAVQTETPAKKPSSPKWSRFGSKSKKSESPEPKEEHHKKDADSHEKKSEKDIHPLQVSTSAPQPSKKDQTPSEIQPSKKDATPSEIQRSVADIVKKYDQPSDSGGATKAADAKASAAKDSKKESPSSKDVKKDHKKGKKDDSKKVTKATKPDKHKPKEDKHKPKEDKSKDKSTQHSPASPHKKFQLFSFFKSKRTYDVAGTAEASGATSSSSPKSKKKSKKDKSLKQPLEEIEKPVEDANPPSVQTRIKQLKDKGVATDRVDFVHVDGGGGAADGVQPGIASEDQDGSPEPQSPPHGSPEPQSGSREPPSPPRGSPEPLSGSPDPQSDSGDELVKSKVEGASSNDGVEGEEVTTTTFEERLKRLQDAFTPVQQPSYERFRSYTSAKMSKEIEVAEILSREREQEHMAHPLWLARVIQGLNKSLERLRKENDIMEVKTSLEILNTIFSNVQRYPEDDTYRRVRISCESFHSTVWKFSNANQFLARSGWVEIHDFIVLPIGKTLDIQKRILDKHLNIVNQMLWSMQLELPDPSADVKRRVFLARRRTSSLMRRESYSTRLVEESLERIERDKMAIAAAKIRSNSLTPSSDEGGSNGVTSPIAQQLQALTEAEEMALANDSFDSPGLAGPAKRREEIQTMQAASTARSKWEQMERKNSLTVLETELYDLLPRKLSDFSHGNGTSDVSDFKVMRRVSNEALPPKQQVSSLAQLPEESEHAVDNTVTAKEGKTQEQSANPTASDPLVLLALSRKSPPPPTQISSSSLQLESGDSDLKQDGGAGEGHASVSNGEELSKPLKSTADAQYSTQSSITSGRLEYEKITLEAAAQTREKWKNSKAVSGSVQESSQGKEEVSVTPSNGVEEEISKL